MIFTSQPYTDLNKYAQDMTVLLPLGAVEQHGPHLGTGTDLDIVSAIAAEVEMRLGEHVLLCPALAFGASHHHLSFGGTISISVQTYTLLIADLLGSLVQTGFRRIVLLNGHGGNITPVKQALAACSIRPEFQDVNIALATYWELSAAVFSGKPPMQSPALSHACEYETSIMLQLFPKKVFQDKINRSEKPAANAYVAWEDDALYRGVTMIKPTAFISGNGSSGEPQLASRGKGKYLFEAAVHALTDFLADFQNWPFLEPIQKQ